MHHDYKQGESQSSVLNYNCKQWESQLQIFDDITLSFNLFNVDTETVLLQCCEKYSHGIADKLLIPNS